MTFWARRTDTFSHETPWSDLLQTLFLDVPYRLYTDTYMRIACLAFFGLFLALLHSPRFTHMWFMTFSVKMIDHMSHV